VVKEERPNAKENRNKTCIPVPTDKAVDLLKYCNQKRISEIAYENEKSMRTEVIDHELMRSLGHHVECMYIGCHTEGYFRWFKHRSI
jgi:L-serine dehydratase